MVILAAVNNQLLKTIWTKLTSPCSDSILKNKLWFEIETQYSANGRHYHNLDHLSFMFRKLQMVETEIRDLQALQFSVFYHDIVYNAKRNDNELKSAKRAAECLAQLQLNEDRIQKTYTQILATKTHQSTDDSDTQYLLDIDLAILGEPWDIYESYTQNIRREYAMYPMFMYTPGRKKVLQHFLAMNRIFKTAYFSEKLEQEAKANLQRELESLSN